MPPFIVVVVYNYRIAYFVEVFLYQLAQQVKLSSDDIANVIKKTRTIIDIQHPKQSGLTMRTLEIVGMKKKIITTNSDIVNYDFYNENNIAIIDRKSPLIDKNFINSPYVELDLAIYEYYSIKKWCLDVLGV